MLVHASISQDRGSGTIGTVRISTASDAAMLAALEAIFFDTSEHAWDSRALRLMTRFVYPFQELGDGLPAHRRPYTDRKSSLTTWANRLRFCGHLLPSEANAAMRAIDQTKSKGGWVEMLLDLTSRFRSLPSMNIKRVTREGGAPGFVHVPCRADAGKLHAPMHQVWTAMERTSEHLGHCCACGRLTSPASARYFPMPEYAYEPLPAAECRPGEPQDKLDVEWTGVFELYGSTCRESLHTHTRDPTMPRKLMIDSCGFLAKGSGVPGRDVHRVSGTLGF